MESVTGTDSPVSSPPRMQLSAPLPPGREDCWSEDATYTLIEAWGERYLELNRGNLRQKHWQEVADAVNDRHGHIKKQRRTDIQCKNRIDTLKKKYKIERARVSDSNGSYASKWPFFVRLDGLIGESFSAKKPSPSPPAPSGTLRRTMPLAWSLPSSVPVGPRSGTQKRSSLAMAPVDDSSYFLRDYSMFSAKMNHAAAAEEDREDSEESRSSAGSRRDRGGDKEKEKENELGFTELAQAIERFGEIYERVEGVKQRQMIELEKQRMQFAKDLEYQRMQLFMETQVQLQKIKRAKRSSGDVLSSCQTFKGNVSLHSQRRLRHYVCKLIVEDSNLLHLHDVCS